MPISNAHEANGYHFVLKKLNEISHAEHDVEVAGRVPALDDLLSGHVLHAFYRRTGAEEIRITIY